VPHLLAGYTAAGGRVAWVVSSGWPGDVVAALAGDLGQHCPGPVEFSRHSAWSTGSPRTAHSGKPVQGVHALHPLALTVAVARARTGQQSARILVPEPVTFAPLVTS
jgi:hypothetical protein